MKITLEELRAWVAVVDTGSITAAAEQLEQMGFSQLDAHNVWPVLQREGEFLRVKPTLCASSGETLCPAGVSRTGL